MHRVRGVGRGRNQRGGEWEGLGGMITTLLDDQRIPAPGVGSNGEFTRAI